MGSGRVSRLKQPSPNLRGGEQKLRVDMLPLRTVRHEIAQVDVAAVGHRSDQIVALIHATPKAIGKGMRLGLKRAGEGLPLHGGGRLAAGDAQQRGGEIDKAHEPVGLSARCVFARGQMPPLGWKENHQRHLQAGVARPAFAARQAGAMVGKIKHDRVVGEAGGLQFSDSFTRLRIGGAHLIVVLRPVAPHFRGVGMIGRHPHSCRIGDGGLPPRPQLALMAGAGIEHREEGLPSRPLLPMGFARGLIPNLLRRDEVVVFLDVVGAVITQLPQMLREQFHAGRQCHLTAHMLGTERRGEHAADERGAGRRADRGIRPGVAKQHAPRSKGIDMRRAGQPIAIAAHLRPVILAGDPEDVRFFSREHRGRGEGDHDQQQQ